MKLTIKKKILTCALVPVFVLGIIVIIITATYVKNSVIDQVENSLRGTAVATLAAYDQNSGAYLEAENGDVWKGSYNISQSENLVDTIKEKSGMDVTFFYGTERIMTSALDEKGLRILGSPAGDVVTERVLKNGEEYFSDNISMDGTIFYGYYVPVYQSGDNSAPIGMVFAGINKEETYGSVISILNVIVFLVLAVMVICTVVVSIIAGTMTKALKTGISNVEEVSSGRLNVEFSNRILERKDEIGDLTRAIEHLQTELRNIIGGISESAERLTEASHSLNRTSHETYENINNVKNAVDIITDGATTQAEDTQKASDNMERMGSLIVETGNEAEDLNASADTMKTSSDKAAVTIEELKDISEEVKRAVAAIAEQTLQTNESAKRIKEASDFISDIASETNLLSLNASIEAARAGEAGRGFAVVASQIQNLAEQSNNASGNIDQIVNTLMADSELVVNTMAHVQEVIDRQNAHIESTEKTVSGVMKEIGVSIEGIKRIENKTKELESSRKEIEEIITSLSHIAEDNVSGTEETNAVITQVADSFRNVEDSAENLKNTADMLAQNMGSFQL
ncbi:MAG: cache domain-containing protein [Lachnospiraceae bacterium]|nr:cache domain-containing protein [Lachnospiraceae bacterium]